MTSERLQKLIARAGLASRRGAEQLIADGRVRVNGRLAALGESADPAHDRIEVDGQALGAAPPAVHLAVHKPRGFLSSARDERGRRSVVSLVDAGGQRLWPAGRLDVESEGLMILTNDGEWANRVLHPRYGNEREYAALVSPPPSGATLARLRSGIELEDGPARLLSARHAPPPREVVRSRSEIGEWLRIRVGEGRKREVRRLFDAVGSEVERLVRVRIGTLTLAGLREGEWRRLRRNEVSALSGSRPR
jgi:23S rRNA pseudouridine2605 synthase